MKSTQDAIDDALKGFEDMVLDLVNKGYSPDKAVRIAYKAYPIMKMLEAPLTADLVQNFDKGYHSVLVPNGVSAPKWLPYSKAAIGAAMRKAWTRDKLTLSERLHGKNKVIRRDVAKVIERALRNNKTTLDMAREIFSGYGEGGVIEPSELPKKIKAISKLRMPSLLDDAAQERFKEVLRRAQRKVNLNTTPALRAAYSEIIRNVEDNNTAELNRATQIAVQEQARYHAERIARTESARAYADGQMSRYMSDDDVVALKWKLSSNHPRTDICDVYANADLYGLGRGVYPKDKFPTLPAHPHCRCRILPVYDFEVDIDRAKSNVERGGKDYLDSLPIHEQESILGVHGRELVKQGKASWTEQARGYDDKVFKPRIPDETE